MLRSNDRAEQAVPIWHFEKSLQPLRRNQTKLATDGIFLSFSSDIPFQLVPQTLQIAGALSASFLIFRACGVTVRRGPPPWESPDLLPDRRAQWPQAVTHYAESAGCGKQDSRVCCFTPFSKTSTVSQHLIRLPL